MTSPVPVEPVAAPVVARWVRDQDYLQAAVCLAYQDENAVRRFVLPLFMALLVAGLFSPWGIPSLWVGGIGGFLLNAVVLLVLLHTLAHLSSQTYPSLVQSNTRRYAFAGASVWWDFGAQDLKYGTAMPDGSGVLHEVRSHWRWLRAISVDPMGLRLHRAGSNESHAIPMDAWVAGSPDGRARLQAAAVEFARSAGVPIRWMARTDWAGLLGTLAGLAILLTTWMTVCAMAAALPYLRHWNVAQLYLSGVDTFWWAGLLLAPVVLAAHLLLAWLLQPRQGGLGLPRLTPHLALAGVWALLLFVVLQSLASEIFEEPQAASSFFDPLPLVCGIALALLIALVVHRGCIAYWVVRRLALHNARTIRLESP